MKQARASHSKALLRTMFSGRPWVLHARSSFDRFAMA